MNRTSLVVRLLAALFALCQAAAIARGSQGEVSYPFFYAALQGKGTWFESANYGYVWQPKIAAENPDWRPYTDGYWSHTEQGWTWVSHEDFGWATFHYGRWANLTGFGWVWVPGFQWAPAWVSWRASPALTGRSVPAANRSAPAIGVEVDDVVGWAPLPPEATFSFTRGLSPQVDLACQIGPGFYNFVPARSFGELILRPWIFRPSANERCIASTWNCTNIIYRPNPGFIWSGGPNYSALRAVVQRPIAQLFLESQFVTDARASGDLNNRVEDDHLIVAAPIVLPPNGQTAGNVGLPPGPATIPPPQGETTIPAQPIDHGWSETKRDAGLAAQLRDEIKLQATNAPQAPVIPAGLGPLPGAIRVQSPKGTEAVPAPSPSRQRGHKARSQAPNPPVGATPPRKKTPGPSRTLPPNREGD
jgi:hypothetical protein